MGIEEVVGRWKRCGRESIHSFDLSNHYSMLFDDEEDGFTYIFDQIKVDKDKILKTENQKIISLFEDVDDGMYEVSYLIENFIRDYLWGKDLDIEEVKDELEQLLVEITENYRGIYSLIQILNKEVEEELINDEI